MFDHFVQSVHPEVRPEPVLLLLDGHSSHMRNLNVINKARESNVIVLSLPPTKPSILPVCTMRTHRIQSLDIAFFKSMKVFYDQAAATWLTGHPGRVITELEIGELFGCAYGKAATLQNAASGFAKAGIFRSIEPCSLMPTSLQRQTLTGLWLRQYATSHQSHHQSRTSPFLKRFLRRRLILQRTTMIHPIAMKY